MPHIKGYPMAGHGRKHRVSGEDEGYRTNAWIDEEPKLEDGLPSRARIEKKEHARICEEGGDCANRVNEELE